MLGDIFPVARGTPCPVQLAVKLHKHVEGDSCRMEDDTEPSAGRSAGYSTARQTV